VVFDAPPGCYISVCGRRRRSQPAEPAITDPMMGMSDPALPFLNESVRVPTPRFQPATFPEFIGSVYTLWCHSHTRTQTTTTHSEAA